MRQEGFWKTNLRPIIFGHLGLRLQGILRGVSGAFWVAMVFMEHLLRERESSARRAGPDGPMPMTRAPPGKPFIIKPRADHQTCPP